MMKLTIRKKVLFCSLIPLLLLGGIILLIASTIVKGAIIDQVENSLKGTAIATQAAYDQNAGTYLQTENGDIWKGSYNISQSENLVDTIKQESGIPSLRQKHYCCHLKFLQSLHPPSPAYPLPQKMPDSSAVPAPLPYLHNSLIHPRFH